jgi:uncharacterized protein YlaI
MKIYCSCCDKVQPVHIDNCRDAKTNEPFQDIVCAECNLVIAAGTDIKREWVGLTDEEIEQGCRESWVTEQAWQSAVWWAEARLKEKNNG